MNTENKLKQFFSSKSFAVIGASTNRQKYGNKVLRCYLQKDMDAHPVNNRADKIEGLRSFATLSELPKTVESISIITPPKITEKIVEEAIEIGIKNIWMQPGAESLKAINKAEEAGVNVLADGICILVVLGYKDSWTPELVG